jgi:hypothetical protein
MLKTENGFRLLLLALLGVMPSADHGAEPARDAFVRVSPRDARYFESTVPCAAVASQPRDSAAAPAQPPLPPNVVVIVADDLGSGDLGYRGSQFRTPHLDRLAAEGVRLEQHGVFPVCSPTRAALLSGRYPTRFGIDTPTNERVFSFDTVTLATALQSVGYQTALVGKWHLGSKPEWGPNHFGFDQSYGLLAGGCGPYCHRYQAGLFSQTWHRDGQLIKEAGHVTDLITREAVRFIEAQRDGPFFLYLPYTAPHIPLDEPELWFEASRHIENPGKRLYAASLSHLDDGIGQVVAGQGQHDDLPPMVCNAGMTRCSWSPRSIILLTMPSARGRRDLTCFASFDEGRTWPVRRRIAPDGGYSDVAVLKDGTILVACEPDGAKRGIVLARCNLAWFTELQP